MSKHLALPSALITVALAPSLSYAPATRADTINRIDRWTQTATDGATGALGDPITLTWSLANDGQSTVGGRASDLVGYLDGKYNVVNGGSDLTTRPWFQYLERGFTRWGEVSGLTYVYEANDSGSWGAGGQLGVRGDLRVGGYTIDGPFGTLGFNGFPDGGDMILDTSESTAFTNPTIFRNTVSHENGHGIGLAHSVGTGFLMNPAVPFSFAGPQFHDILAVQRAYGDPLEKNGGNDTAATATSLGALAIGQTAGRGFDAPDQGDSPLSIGGNHVDLVSIDDDSDSDFYRFTTAGSTAVSLKVDPKGPTYNLSLQGGNPVPYNASNRSDLVLDLFASDQTTRLISIDFNPAGGNEQVAAFKLPEGGEYFAQVRGKNNQAQMYSFEVGVGSSNASGQAGLIFIDDFTMPQASPNAPNSFRQGITRQGPGLVDSPYRNNGNGDTRLVEVDADRLRLLSKFDGTNAQNTTLDLMRNFSPQVKNERWAYTFDAELVPDDGVGDAWLGFNFADTYPAGSPLNNSAELTMLLRPNGDTSGRVEGDSVNLGSISGNTTRFELIVNETDSDDVLFDLIINGSTRLNDQAITFDEDGRYFTFTNHIGASGTSTDTSFQSFLDNFLLETIAGPLGDVNFDGLFDMGDIDSFVIGLQDADAYRSIHLYSPMVQGDINLDGLFDYYDIVPFATLLGGDALAEIQRQLNIPTPSSGIALLIAGLITRRRRPTKAVA